MKKLIVLMIFVLLFSITILAGDLSKEEIVNEFKKIAVVANRDIRLEMYDILSGKLGLKIAEDPIIASYSGNENKSTRPFTVNTAWEIQWDVNHDFSVYLYDEDGEIIDKMGSQKGAGKGTSYNPKKGTYFLKIIARGDWEIKIVAVE